MSKANSWPTKSFIGPPRLMLVIGVICLVLPALVWTYKLRSPSDGARMSKLPGATTSLGISIDVLSQDSSLQNGDLVVGVQDVPMAGWVEALWHPQSWSARWTHGETVQYRVVRQGQPVDVPVLLGSQPVSAILTENWSVLLFTIVFQLIAIFIILQKPGDPAAQALFIWGMTTSHFYIWSFFLQIYDIVNGYGFWLYSLSSSFLWLLTWPAALHLALTFPTPLPLVQRRPWLVWLVYPLSYATFILYLAVSRWMIPSTLEWIGLWNRGDTLVAILMFVPAVAVMVWQYRLHRSGPDRRKIQWVVYSGLFSGSLVMIFYLIPEFLGLPGLGVNAVGIMMLPFPVAIAIAIWRYQLFDINLIIHRTLVYGALTLTLAVVFLSSVTLLQIIFSAVTGQRSAVATVISTLLIAALFSPLRHRIQHDIDRRFFRQKYNAEQAIERFAAAARSETDIDRLSAELLAVVAETMQPESVSLWLKPVERNKGN
jgi:hypothetical protein